MTGVLYRLARLCVRYRFAVVAAWVVLVGLSHRLGDNTNDSVTLPGNQQPAGRQHRAAWPRTVKIAGPQ